MWFEKLHFTPTMSNIVNFGVEVWTVQETGACPAFRPSPMSFTLTKITVSVYPRRKEKHDIQATDAQECAEAFFPLVCIRLLDRLLSGGVWK